MRAVLNYLFITFLFFSPIHSFSQTKPAIEIYDSKKVSKGYILWMDRTKSLLMDYNGKNLFSFPGNYVAFFNDKEEIASHTDGNLVVYNKDLDIIWRKNTYIHHELTITPDNKIFLLSTEAHLINKSNLRFDNIYCFDITGKKLFTWSTYDQRSYLMSYMMKDTNIFLYKKRCISDPDSALNRIIPGLHLISPEPMKVWEFFHMNAIQVIPENDSEKKDTVFKKGNILLSFCNYSDSIASFIAIVDPVHYQILWHYVNKHKAPMHTPAMLPNGHILIYINSTKNNDDFSIIEEIDPITKEIVWSYPEPFPESQRRNAFGSCQRLTNGNTLISNNDGYIYEVTPNKKIVWQWYINEIMDTNSYLYRAFLYPGEKLNWLFNEE